MFIYLGVVNFFIIIRALLNWIWNLYHRTEHKLKYEVNQVAKSLEKKWRGLANFPIDYIRTKFYDQVFMEKY